VKPRCASLAAIAPCRFAWWSSSTAAWAVIPARALRRSYQVEIECADALAICPRCEGIDLELTAGDELILESLEYIAPRVDSKAKE